MLCLLSSFYKSRIRSHDFSRRIDYDATQTCSMNLRVTTLGAITTGGLIEARKSSLSPFPRSGGVESGLRKLSEEMERDQYLQKTVQTLCETLRKGWRFEKSIRHA